MKKGADNSLTAGAKWWQCSCGQGNSVMLARCGSCGAAKNGMFPGEFKTFEDVHGKPKQLGAVPKPRQNNTEKAYGLILEAQKRRGEIVEYRPFGIRLEWGENPETGKPQVYTPDFYVVVDELHHETNLQRVTLPIRIVEVKRKNIWPADKVRFRGCRAAWPMFDFQMWRRLDMHSPFERIE